MKTESGNIAAGIEDLYRLYYRPLCLYAMHFVDDVDLAEDLVQEVFIVLYEKVSAGFSVNNAKSYLFRAVRNRSIDILRKDSRTDLRVSLDFADIADDTQLQEQSMEEARLWTAIDKLPEKCREVLLLSKRDGLKYEEIAGHLGISVNTVRNQISKALKIIKNGTSRILMFFS